jgi:ABC-type polysaccharide/polyol phosphate transport system ATPase subunit
MNRNIVISTKGIGKKYILYPSPKDRLKEVLNPFSKKYHKEFWALNNISLDVTQGETVGIIGENGSGKSTLLQIISGTLNPTEGSVSVKGRISALLELGAGFNPEFSAKENVYLNGAIMGFSKSEMDERFPSIEEFADIGEFIHQPMKTYSSGMYVRVAFASAINVDPDILVIDEALSVGDVYFQQKCFSKLADFRQQGKTILFVSHDAGAIKRLCQRAYLLERGKIIEHGKPDEVLDYYNALLALKKQKDVRIEMGIKNNKGKDEVTWVKQANRKTGRSRAHSNKLNLQPHKDYGEKDAEVFYRSGNKDIVITDSYILSNGVRAEIIPTGTLVDICIEATAHNDEKDVSFGILIRDRFGIDIFGINTWHLRKSATVKKGEVVRVAFTGKLDIGPGEYTLTVASHSKDTHVDHCYDWIDKHSMFRVIPDNEYSFIGFARMDLKVTIDISSHPASAEKGK